jgi:alkanesulfonate monooxygenase SsuD/methylene tetrahydromethanopterin reductase-like flavin-dependent oxidoreductase (luciferase family)
MSFFIGYFTERPYQDRHAPWYQDPDGVSDLSLSNGLYDPKLGAELYHRYIDEKILIEEMGFDGVALNSHHSTAYCMGGGPMNIEAALIAKVTERVKIALIGNVLPIWEDPLWLVEELAMIDMLSRGRLVSGFIRGSGRESWAHNANPTENWERYQEAHDFIVKAWSTPGPFRWEGKHYHYRYVNPWMRPYQAPHPPIWVPGVLSRATVEWAAERRYPYIMLASSIEATKQSFQYYRECAARNGYEAGPQHLGYMMRLHVEETEELAYDTGRKIQEGPGNIFMLGSKGVANKFAQNLPGLNARMGLLPTVDVANIAKARGRETKAQLEAEAKATGEKPLSELTPEEFDARRRETFDATLEMKGMMVGTPDSILPQIRHVLEELRPGHIIFWFGDGDQSHEEFERCARLMGEYVLPEVREMARELGLESSFAIDPATNQRVDPQPLVVIPPVGAGFGGAR